MQRLRDRQGRSEDGSEYGAKFAPLAQACLTFGWC